MLIKKLKLIFILIAIIGGVFLLADFSTNAQVDNPDGVAVRVMPNDQYLSPTRWYLENIKQQGSPSELLVNGYQAVRDGRTVYVSASNIDSHDNYTDGEIDQVSSDMYVNMFIISYTQDASNDTVDIFGQLLENWEFNTNIMRGVDMGKCVSPDQLKDSSAVGNSCFTDYQCGYNSGLYCSSVKAKITRDVKRLADLRDIQLALNNYKSSHENNFPALAAGSYIAGKTISVWPSWQNALGKELGVSLPVDPVNKLSCPVGSDPNNDGTCWDDKERDFASNANIPGAIPGYAYAYTYGDGSITTCSVMESGLSTGLAGSSACAGSLIADTLPGNRAPVIIAPSTAVVGQTVYIYAYDPDGDDLVWSGTELKPTGLINYREWNISSESTTTVSVSDGSLMTTKELSAIEADNVTGTTTVTIVNIVTGTITVTIVDP